MADESKTTIIKKVKKGGHGHHGGAWKVAYADFVTAMMAFFLLLWLLNSATQEQLEGISNYFAPISVSQSTSGAGDVLGGESVADSGALGQPSQPSILIDLPAPRASRGRADADESESPEPLENDSGATAKEREEEQFVAAEESLRQAIQAMPELAPLAQSLLIDNTREGLRVQIVDQEGLAMFPSGSAEMHEHTRRILGLVAKVVETMPQKVAIAGHTDAVPFSDRTEYGNWELSADRANASRRVLMDAGVSEDRIARVVGKAAEDPLMPDDPKNARNRRISIILLRGTGGMETASDL